MHKSITLGRRPKGPMTNDRGQNGFRQDRKVGIWLPSDRRAARVSNPQPTTIMRKRRCDSPWSKLTDEQHELMETWFFDDNLGHKEILERAEKEFGIRASQQTLTGYFRHRERLLNLPDGHNEIEPEEQEAMATRIGAGMSLEDLEARTMNFAMMAAYEMSMAGPEKMRIKEMGTLLKMINNHRQLSLERREREEILAIGQLALLGKLRKDDSKRFAEERWEDSIIHLAGVLRRARRKSAEQRAREESKQEEKAGESAPDKEINKVL